MIFKKISIISFASFHVLLVSSCADSYEAINKYQNITKLNLLPDITQSSNLLKQDAILKVDDIKKSASSNQGSLSLSEKKAIKESRLKK